MKKKILVRGPALIRGGYGEQTRFALRALRAYEDYFDIYLFTTSWGQCGWIWTDDEERAWIDNLLKKTVEYQQGPEKGKFDMSLQITIPNEFEKFAPINIGYTAGIETTKIAPPWVEKSLMMDKILVVSNHAKYGFENTSYTAKNNQTGEVVPNFKCTTPIEVVSYPVREAAKTNIELELEHDFNFLVVAQWGPRKNVASTVKWFVEEFIDQPVGLVLKLNIRSNSIEDREATENKLKELLEEYPNRKCSVHLVHGDMTDGEMASLYSHPKIKALLSLAHGEGFGLPIFEAVSAGLPVVAPLWSGYCDFCYLPKKDKKTGKEKMRPGIVTVDYDIAQIQKEAVWDGVLEKDSMWCYPKQGSFKMRLREVYKEYSRIKAQAKTLQKYVLKSFTEEKQNRLFAEAVYGQPIVEVSVEELPKISLITSVWNGEQHLESFFQDLIRQTVWDKCELILVHPRTSPGYKEEKKIIDKYRAEYENIRYKALKEDPGVYGCWNTAVKMSTGEFITNCNLDDRRAQNCVERQAKYLVANSRTCLVYADSLITDKPNETFENNSSEGKLYNAYKGAFSIEAMLRTNLPHNYPMWRKALHDKCGYFSEEYFSASDWDFWLNCAFYGFEFGRIDQPLGLYYFSPTGLSTNPETEKQKRQQEMEIFKKYQKRYMAGDYNKAQ